MTHFPAVAAAALGVAALVMPAHADQQSDIEAACRTQAWLPAAACPCIAREAIAELNETQRDWLVATTGEDQAEAMRLQGAMSSEEMVQVGSFMIQKSASCPQ